MSNLGVGIIGCGHISATYLRLAPMFRGFEIRAVADIDDAAALARAEEFGVRHDSVEALLGSGDIDIVANLTVPSAHFEISSNALASGKHVYSEKPFVLSLEEGAEIARLAGETGRRVGSAPDTFLGGSHQLARHVIDSGMIGTVTSGTAFAMNRGMEHWHPNPDFFFLPGAGPVLDIGPYCVTCLVQLIGPVRRVAAVSATPSRTRTILSEPRRGERIPVRTPTTIHGILEFHGGAVVTMAASWDVWAHGHRPMEIHGTEASLDLPDPNFFGGEIFMARANEGFAKVDPWDHPLAVANQDGGHANYRAAGLADMALAIRESRPHRCSMELALHAVEVMAGILKSGEEGEFMEMTTACERPAPLGPDEARALLNEERR